MRRELRHGAFLACVGLALGTSSCKGDDDGSSKKPSDTGTALVESTDTGTTLIDTCDLTWERDITGFFDNWCAPCHSAAIPPAWRQGAPDGVDLQNLDDVKIWAERVRATALVDSPTMPPAGGTSAVERSLVTRWLDCGMPGTETLPVDPCDGAVVVTVAPTEDLSGLCTGDGRVVADGDVVIDDALTLDCVCEITGSVQLQAALAAGSLKAIGGALTVSGAGTLDALQLRSVGGDLEITDISTPLLAIPELRSVGGQLWIHDTRLLQDLQLDWLQSLGGPLLLADAPALKELVWPRLATVVGDVRFERLPLLTSVESLVSVVHVTGELVIAETGVEVLNDMRGYEQIDGGIRIENNADLNAIDGFWHLTSVPSIAISDAPQLQGIGGFDILTQVDLLEVRDAPLLRGIELDLLEELGALGETNQGLALIDVGPLEGLSFPSLRVLGTLFVQRSEILSTQGLNTVNTLGDVTFLNNDSLVSIDQPDKSVQLGSLRLEGNDNLEQVIAFRDTTTLLGPLEVTDSASLEVLALGALVSIDGDLVLDEAPRLENLASLSALDFIGGALQLTDLPSVSDVTSLHGLQQVSGDVTIRRNPSLSAANVAALIDEIDQIGGSLDVGDNGP